MTPRLDKNLALHDKKVTRGPVSFTVREDMGPTCTDIQESISLLVAGELPEDQREAVELHLAACASCAQLRSRFERMNALLASAPVPVPSRDELSLISLRARASSGALAGR